MRALVGCLVLAACGKDVRLGTAPDAPAAIDAPTIDGALNPFQPGTYVLAFVDPVDVVCDGDLTGMEASFMSITRAALMFEDGITTFTAPDATSLVVSGAPITTGFGGDLTMTEEPDPPPGEPANPVVWGAIVTQDFGAGPLSTTNTQRFLGVDTSTATAAAIDTYGAALYEKTPADLCSVAFHASFTPQ